MQLMIVNGFLFDLLQKCPKSIKGYFREMIIMISIIVYLFRQPIIPIF